MADNDLVPLEHASTPFEATVIAGVLTSAGIPAYIDGSLLTDEFVSAQRLMNLRGTTVTVPATQLDAARQALKAAREAGKNLE